MSDIIRLNNIRIKAKHGYYQAERELGQLFEVDLELSLDLNRALETDQLEDSVDFEEVHKDVVAEFSENQSWLIEALGGKIITRLFDKHKSVDKITIRIRKPQIPINGILDNAEIELTRKRK